MIFSLVAVGILAIATPLLTRWLKARVFWLIALAPAALFGITLAQAPGVLAGTPVTETFPWIPQLGIELSFRMDPLALLLALIVTGVGALVLAYCARYFSDDEPGLGRFAALLLAFAGVMYGLVTSDDVIVMFVFWEATSVLSYLLIGHNTGRKSSRGAALQALTVTTFGGLAMLVGIVMLVMASGTTSITEIVANPVGGTLGQVAIVLVLLGALSKSALVPFHFWLPAAMAAPTPVSAYLHAAAMVKAGIYIIARFAPGYADQPLWQPLLVTIGVLTMLVGGWRAMRQYDLKLILAYGTVSQLGFLTIMLGFGTRDAALAGAALLLAHALYKATLFLVVGIIDHATGTRDWRKLSGLGRRMPVLAVIASIAVASMAGLPPLLGFVAKESVFASLLEATSGGAGQSEFWAWFALVGVVLGSVLTVAYSLRFIWGAFSTKADVGAIQLHNTGFGILTAPLVLSLATIGGGVAAGTVDALVAPYADTLPGPHEQHLALWHGFEPALAISAGVLLLGFVLMRRRRQVARLQAKLPQAVDAGREYVQFMRALDRFAAALTTRIQRGGLPAYLAVIIGVFVLGLGLSAALNRSWPEGVVPWDYAVQPFIALVMGMAAIGAAIAGHRMTAVLLVGVTGYGLVLLFAMGGAPDLALTQALVETLTVVVFVLVLRRLPQQIAARNKAVRKGLRAALGILAGTVMAVIAVIALGAREAASISAELPALAAEAHGKNIVNVMLVDIRAWDTMGEIAVLVAVATGVASLVFISGRAAPVERMEGGGERRNRPVLNSSAVSRQTWLLAGRTLSPQNRSIIIEVLVRLLFHPAIIVSIYLLFVGHNQPGGGFAGGLLAGLALVARYLAGGRYELAEAVPIDAGKLLGTGLLLAVGTALSSMFFGLQVLESSWFEASIPVLGEISIGTSTIFDIGVYLVVFGLVLDILRSLGSEVDRQQEDQEDDEEDAEYARPSTSDTNPAKPNQAEGGSR
ncbi:Na+/H+ antiporter subunit A [Microterricola pindariensis]|uniref:Na+/H+ antiporter subunit A n=1 Tax=Microterricola pindariensis TaxID=478010 RepID=A0ABX5AYH3_9MICO|nr:Na+/H+ antiporter subunit A [Microterricola pindariensis]PPL19951.1 Na+/H+ antiporter subunit A [Microterricola pindariensis]